MSYHTTIEEDVITSPSLWKTIVSDENPELLKKAREELNECPEERDRDIMVFREMILDEKTLKSPIDDAFLLRFLRVRKFNIERAFTLLKKYYAIRLKYPKILVYYCPSSAINFLNDHACVILPNKDRLGRNIVIGRFGRWNPPKVTIDEVLAGIHMCMELALLQEEMQVHGVVVIADMTDFGMRQIRYVTPNVARKFATLIQDYLPVRFKGFHIIFESIVFDLAFMVLKPFLTKKTKSRIYFHGDSLESLHDQIDPEFLPEDYGGTQHPVQIAADLQLRALLAREEEIVNFVANSGYDAAGQRG